MYSIYALHLPDGDYRYIGMTGNLTGRMGAHRYQARHYSRGSGLYQWFSENLQNVCATVIDVCDDSREAEALEAYWIAAARATSDEMFNLSEGGPGPKGVPNSNSRKTLCVHGHEFTSENTYLNSRGSRQCRECRRVTDRSRYTGERREQLLTDSKLKYREHRKDVMSRQYHEKKHVAKKLISPQCSHCMNGEGG